MDRKSGLSVEAYNHDEHWNNIVKWLYDSAWTLAKSGVDHMGGACISREDCNSGR